MCRNNTTVAFVAWIARFGRALVSQSRLFNKRSAYDAHKLDGVCRVSYRAQCVDDWRTRV